MRIRRGLYLLALPLLSAAWAAFGGSAAHASITRWLQCGGPFRAQVARARVEADARRADGVDQAVLRKELAALVSMGGFERAASAALGVPATSSFEEISRLLSAKGPDELDGFLDRVLEALPEELAQPALTFDAIAPIEARLQLQGFTVEQLRSGRDAWARAIEHDRAAALAFLAERYGLAQRIGRRRAALEIHATPVDQVDLILAPIERSGLLAQIAFHELAALGLTGPAAKSVAKNFRDLESAEEKDRLVGRIVTRLFILLDRDPRDPVRTRVQRLLRSKPTRLSEDQLGDLSVIWEATAERNVPLLELRILAYLNDRFGRERGDARVESLGIAIPRSREAAAGWPRFGDEAPVRAIRYAVSREEPIGLVPLAVLRSRNLPEPAIAAVEGRVEAELAAAAEREVSASEEMARLALVGDSYDLFHRLLPVPKRLTPEERAELPILGQAFYDLRFRGPGALGWDKDLIRMLASALPRDRFEREALDELRDTVSKDGLEAPGEIDRRLVWIQKRGETKRLGERPGVSQYRYGRDT